MIGLKLTRMRRSSPLLSRVMVLLFLPLTISRSMTPKLKTSDFTEKTMFFIYSGEI